MKNTDLFSYVKECENEYKKIFCITDFPEYEIIKRKISIEKADKSGYESLGKAIYDIPTGKHTLAICPQIDFRIGKSIIFHELTHILDDEEYVNMDKIRYMSNHGYTEYHAAQAEMIQLLGVESIHEGISFRMNRVLDTVVGNKTVKEYVEIPHREAAELISRTDFPADIEALAVTIGLIFNYYGKRSICKMYAVDYQDGPEYEVIQDVLSAKMIKALNEFMVGWFEKGKIDKINEIYQNVIFALVSRYSLHR